MVYKMSGKYKNESSDTSDKQHSPYKLNVISTSLEITMCAENSESLGSIGSSMDWSQLPVSSTVKANKEIKEHAWNSGTV